MSAAQYADMVRRSRALVDRIISANFAASSATSEEARLKAVQERSHAVRDLQDHANAGWRLAAEQETEGAK